MKLNEYCRKSEMSDHWASEKWAVGEVSCRRSELPEKWTVGEVGCRRSDVDPRRLPFFSTIVTHNTGPAFLTFRILQ